MKLAFIGSLPTGGIFPPEVLRDRGEGYEHPAPWTIGLLPNLAKSTNWKLRVFIPHWKILRPIVVEKDGVEYEGVPVKIPMRFFRKSYYHSISIFTTPAIRRWSPDLIHAFGFETGSAMIALRSGFPVTAFIQGISEYLKPYYKNRPWLDKELGARAESKAVSRVSWMVAETEFAKNWALKRNPGAMVQIIPHPVREEFLSQEGPTMKKKFVTVGSLDARKAVDVIIKAFALSSLADFELVVIGNGPDLQKLRRLAFDLGVGERVHFEGALGKEELIERLRNARASIIASRMDTSPNVVTEAHAIGLPVIGTRVGGIPEMIDHGKDGWTVEMDDADAMAGFMIRLAEEMEEARSMGQVGREKVKTLNCPVSIAAAHVDFFNMVRENLQNTVKASPH